MLDIRKLRMLAELERLGTIAAVAHELQQTAPGVSMQIATLEREVGLKLTEKAGRTLTLTPAGHLLARHGHDIVDMLALADMEAAALREGAAGTYRLAAFPSAARTIVADTWRALLDNAANGLRLEVIELEPQDSLTALVRGEVEIALTHAYSNMPAPTAHGLIPTLIATETVWLAVRSDDAALEPTPRVADLRDFATRPWIVPHRQWTCHEMVQRACGLAGFQPRAVAEASDFAVILALVAAGAGVALIPALTIAQLPANVTMHPLVTPVFRHDFVVTRPATDADPGIRRLRGLLAATARQLVPPVSAATS